MSKLRSLLVLAVMASALSGCKDDPLGVNSGDPLTEDEIQEVFFALSEAFSSLNLAPAAASGPARASISFNESFDATAPYPGEAGTISASGSANGTVDDQTFEFDLAYQLRMTPNGCLIPTETGTVTLDGAPHIQLDMDFQLTDTQIVVSGSETGGIAFTSDDGRSGSCAFDVQFSFSSDLEGSGTASASGTVCGVSASNLTVFDADIGIIALAGG